MDLTTELTGTIFNIQRFSIHDGPGIRTTVFLKGCNLRCQWCHNPESQLMGTEIEYYPEKCIACGGCAAVCEHGAQLMVDGLHVYQREQCRVCRACVAECFSGALLASGERRTVGQVLAEIARDAEYYQRSGGGVTFSGGEPMLQPEFLKALLHGCKQAGHHCAVDTAGHIPWERLEAILPDTDLFLYDLKGFDEATHRQSTGAGNRLIHANLRRLSAAGKELWIRIPLVAGVNDTPAEIAGMGDLIGSLDTVRWVEILPFHSLGAEKYAALEKAYPASGHKAPSKERIAEILAWFQTNGINARCME